MTRLRTPFKLAILTMALLCGASRARATNLLANASFELGYEYWVPVGSLGVEINTPSAEGTNHVVLGDLWQDVPTQPSVTYYLRFYTRQVSVAPAVHFGEQTVALSPLPTNPPTFAWYFLDGYATAVSNVTRLEFINMQSGTRLDDVRLIDSREPVQILREPQGRAAIEGGTVLLSVGADGGPPIRYAWQFNGTLIPGATNASLVLVNVSNANAGTYSVTVSNAVSSITTTGVSLTVEPLPLEPVIVGQPGGWDPLESTCRHASLSIL